MSDQEYQEKFAKLDPHKPSDRVYGVIYEIHPEDVNRVMEHLDYREKNGYTLTSVDVEIVDAPGKIIRSSLYIGTHDNSEFLGPAPPDEIARQIASSVGPSGRNIDYLLKLCKSMRDIDPHHIDEHLADLETRVCKIKQ